MESLVGARERTLDFEDLGVLLKAGTEDEKRTALELITPFLLDFIIRKHKGALQGSYEIADFLQELYIVTLQAAKSWTPRKGSFYTYLKTSLANRMKRLARKLKREKLEIFVSEPASELFAS